MLLFGKTARNLGGVAVANQTKNWHQTFPIFLKARFTFLENIVFSLSSSENYPHDHDKHILEMRKIYGMLNAPQELKQRIETADQQLCAPFMTNVTQFDIQKFVKKRETCRQALVNAINECEECKDKPEGTIFERGSDPTIRVPFKHPEPNQFGKLRFA